MGKRLVIGLIAVSFLALPLLAGAGGKGHYHGVKTFQLMGVADVEMDFELVNTKIDIGDEGWAITVGGYVKALSKNDQYLMFNDVLNQENSNTAQITGEVMKNAQGYIDVNVAAGDFNAQSNVGSISVSQQERSMANAKNFSEQKAMFNDVTNNGVKNSATVDSEVLKNAQGRIAVNVAAGNNNAQSNLLAIAVAPTKVAQATSFVSQTAMKNDTYNNPVQVEEVRWYYVDLDLSAWGDASSTSFGGGYFGYESGTVSGDITGMSYQANNFYPDVWVVNDDYEPHNQHPYSPRQIGHIDMDYETQGAVINPISSTEDNPVGGLAFDHDQDLNGEYHGTEGGLLGGFIGGQRISLTGEVTGSIPVVVTRNVNTTNLAKLSGNALMNAQGVISVNIAAGTNNLQANALSISYVPGPQTGPVPTPEAGISE